jgi:DMSO reductase anchor subunit
MKPAFSVIFFTVSSGAGFGLIALLLMVHILQFGGGLSPAQMVAGELLALVLISAGLLSSTLHLANPKNAWRAFSRFKTSWLSREGVFSVLFYPFALASLALAYFEVESGLRLFIEAVTVVLAWITLYCTGMIYASLKPIPQWHTPLVPAGYLILGHFSGALLLLVVAAFGGNVAAGYLHMALAWLVLGAALKAIYFAWVASSKGPTTINTAVGITRAQVRLLDAGHTHGTFLTNEFGFTMARQHAATLKIAVFVLAFLLPLLVLTLVGAAMVPALVAAALTIAGLLVERWLFFAEARHVVRVYHGI